MLHVDLSSEIEADPAAFCGTVLPEAASALYGNEDVLGRFLLTLEPEEKYADLLDAIVAQLVSELGAHVRAYYCGRAPHCGYPGRLRGLRRSIFSWPKRSSPAPRSERGLRDCLRGN